MMKIKSNKPQKYPDRAYIETPLFEDRDTDIRCRTVEFVVTRKTHRCAFGGVIDRQHEIPVGTKTVRESAIVEGAWGNCHSCLSCIDVWLDEIKWE